MPSPFPGMNPYLEHPLVWQNVHESLIPAIRDDLARQVRPRYFVQLDEHIFIHELSGEERRFLGRPDLAVIPLREGNRPQGGTGLLEAPVEVIHPTGIDELRSSFLEIRDRESNAVVTVVELLCPANKVAGADREQYLAKRNRVLKSWTNLVEIDLLRAGPRMPDATIPDCDYVVTVSRWDQRPRAGCWPWNLRDPIPTFPVPLRSGEDDATVSLKSIIDRVYDAAGYEDVIYRRPPSPPLTPEDQAWAEGILKSVVPA